MSCQRNMRYILVKSSYDDLRVNAEARRYDLVVKRCLRLATRVSPSDEDVNAFLHHLDDFEHKFAELQLESGSTKVKENTVADKDKKILSPHVVQGKGRLPTKRKVLPMEKATTKRRKKQTCRKNFDDKAQYSDLPESQVGGSLDETIIPTQCSTLSQPMLPCMPDRR
ncbi:hypothetical protein F2P56_007735 [Juglans regia]|uniref:Uncharacterized protein n=1 Tax=Juglans regia TaxID=51240 RepID=A0A833Y4X1_JUGRE|nr:hypothetical protein F2P56_007735 [Juglans regia]